MADPRLDPRPLNGNERLFDAALRHQVGLRRFASGEVRRVLGLLEEADADLVRLLRARLGEITTRPLDLTSRRLASLLDDVRAARREAMSAVRGELSPVLRELSAMEGDFESQAISRMIGFDIEFASVDLSQLRSVVFTMPFNGNTLQQWYTSLAASDRSNLTRAIQLGLAQGETLDQVVRRVAGTRANRFADGVLAISRRNAETVVRTAVNGVANAAREQLWAENADIISALRWTSTLDGRTSPICRARDGALAPVTPGAELPRGARRLDPPGARPPAHPACRSVMVAVINGFRALGRRPSVRDTTTRAQREVNFRRIARQERRPIAEVRRRWADENVGSVPVDVTYQDWLFRQPASFQDDVLGVSRARLFRRSRVRLEQFVDESGREFTIGELRRSIPAAFVEAGL